MNILRNRLVLYMFSLITCSFIIYIGVHYEAVLLEESKNNFTVIPVVIFQSIFALILGVAFAIPRFAMAFQEDGRMTFDWLKFVIFGIPSLIITVLPLIVLTELLNTFNINLNMLSILVDEKIHLIGGIVFGFTLLSSWYKTRLRFTIS